MKEKEEEREMWRMGKMKFHHRPHPPTFHNPHPHLPHKHLTDEIPSAHQSTSFPCLCLWMICEARYCGVPQCAGGEVSPCGISLSTICGNISQAVYSFPSDRKWPANTASVQKH